MAIDQQKGGEYETKKITQTSFERSAYIAKPERRCADTVVFRSSAFQTESGRRLSGDETDPVR
jgi:hypothetical protein